MKRTQTIADGMTCVPVSPRVAISSGIRRSRFIVGALLFGALLTSIPHVYAYNPGECEFESADDVGNAINDAMMKDTKKWPGGIDTNSDGVADALESRNHSLSGPSQFGNYMCSEFAALALCVLKLEYNCTPEQVQMVTGEGHAVAGVRDDVIKEKGPTVDGFRQIDFSWPNDIGSINIGNAEAAGGIGIRDGIYNVGPDECADGFAILQGSGGGGGIFGSGGNIGQQLMLAMMMSQLMKRGGQQNQQQSPKMDKVYEAIQKKKKEAEAQRLAATQTAEAQATETAIAEKRDEPTPTSPEPFPTPDIQPTVATTTGGVPAPVPTKSYSF